MYGLTTKLMFQIQGNGSKLAWNQFRNAKHISTLQSAGHKKYTSHVNHIGPITTVFAEDKLYLKSKYDRHHKMYVESAVDLKDLKMSKLVQQAVKRTTTRNAFLKKGIFVANRSIYFQERTTHNFRLFSTSSHHFQSEQAATECINLNDGEVHINKPVTLDNPANNTAAIDKTADMASTTPNESGTTVVENSINNGSFDKTVETTSVPASSENSNELVLDFLPDRPTPLETGTSAEFLGMDPPLESLGLASWWPPGRMQYLMEYLHLETGLDLPWWQVIMLITLCMRMITFPLVIIAQRNVARLNNNMPQMQILQEKLTDARRRGDMYDSAQIGMELQKFMKEKNVHPLKNMIPLFFQIPIFMSMFFGLRGMTELPLESMMSGGLLWFQDLTVKDPYYMLSFLISGSFWLQLKLGADGANLQAAGPIAKIFLRVFPVILFPMTMTFPAAVALYWCTTNIISVIQARFIRIQAVRNLFGIPKIIQWDKNKLPVKEKGIRESFRETIDNWRVQNEIVDRRSVDATTFRSAGSAKPKKTFKYDPTKPRAHTR